VQAAADRLEGVGRVELVVFVVGGGGAPAGVVGVERRAAQVVERVGAAAAASNRSRAAAAASAWRAKAAEPVTHPILLRPCNQSSFDANIGGRRWDDLPVRRPRWREGRGRLLRRAVATRAGCFWIRSTVSAHAKARARWSALAWGSKVTA
jgi:hypothetical protein